jgi:hypothetical protein
MIKFETKVFPLCDQVLRYRLVSKVNVYDCPTQFEYRTLSSETLQVANAHRSHYEVEYDQKGMGVQHIYIRPWSIDNFENETRLHKFQISQYGTDVLQFVADTPLIHADTEEKILARINTLVTFL